MTLLNRKFKIKDESFTGVHRWWNTPQEFQRRLVTGYGEDVYNSLSRNLLFEVRDLTEHCIEPWF